jgi:LysR family glycine cleavage system transcriptional activator
MVEHRPSLTSIRAFEAIARHKSISSAADELGVSQPAVSQQLRHLEGNLGCVLTIRRARGIELTREGEVLAARLTQAFAEIWAGIEIARRFDGRERSISVCLLPTFAQRWLVHRLVTFYERFPDIGVRLISADSIEDLDRVDADIVIRCGRPHGSGVRAEPLMANRYFPVASPKLIARHPIEMPGDLRNHTLIRIEAEPRHLDWPRWFQEARSADILPRRRVSVSNSSQAIEAAVAGLGVTIAHSPFVTDALASGALVAPLHPYVDSDDGDYFVVSDNQAPPHVDDFRQWLIAQADGGLG